MLGLVSDSEHFHFCLCIMFALCRRVGEPGSGSWSSSAWKTAPSVNANKRAEQRRRLSVSLIKQERGGFIQTPRSDSQRIYMTAVFILYIFNKS